MVQTKAIVDLPPKLVPVFLGKADIRGAFGGRGSAKTRSFAKMTAVKGYQFSKAGKSGTILCGRQFQNSLDDSSLSEVKAAINSEPWLSEFYDCGEKYVKSRDGSITYSFSGLDRNISSVKSKSRILLAWVDEAEPVIETAWQTLIPTVREEGSETWLTWNPGRKGSATDLRYRNTNDPLIKIAKMNWRDNPWFTDKLERERQRDLLLRPESYDHVWEGDYIKAIKGAYYASHITKARSEGRIGRVSADPLMTIRLFMDIGGTGARSDAFSIWVAQFIGREVRVLNYYEAVGQPIGAHLEWLRSHDYTADKAQIWLPHDGSTQDRVYDVSYESAFKKAGYSVTVVPNQGKGAASARIEKTRELFPSIWFNETKDTQPGLDALGWYHEKIDESRDIGLGPEHDWASHGADAFGLMAVVHKFAQAPAEKIKFQAWA